VDFALDPRHDILLRNPNIARSLTLQNTLGYRGEQTPRTLSAKVGWVTIHLKMISLAFAMYFNKPGNQTIDFSNPGKQYIHLYMCIFNNVLTLLKTEIIQSLFGIVKWSIDLIQYLTDELLTVRRAIKGQNQNLSLIQSKVTELNTPALGLILCSIPRTLLKHNARGIRGLDHTATKFLQASVQTDAQKAVYKNLKDLFDAAPVKVSHFEKILTEVDGFVKAAYTSSNPKLSELDRVQLERSLLISQDMPECFKSVTEKLFGQTLTATWNDIDPADLRFWDISWLGLADDRRSFMYKKQNVVDVVRKIVLRAGPPGTGFGEAGPGISVAGGGGMKLRRCSRCCAMTEDVLPTRNQSMWTQMQRMCVCGTTWMLVK
jgi:mediator of RNA polymerase II transcription subunit 16, fungi type